jgi:crossover junction endodeoxyribonuclease RuvC
MKILGIDPGTINCGYAILEMENTKIKLIEAGIIKMKSRILQEQILEFVEGLDFILKKHKID